MSDSARVSAPADRVAFSHIGPTKPSKKRLAANSDKQAEPDIIALQCTNGVKGKSGILKNMEMRKTFLSDPEHQIRFIYTPFKGYGSSTIQILSELVEDWHHWCWTCCNESFK